MTKPTAYRYELPADRGNVKDIVDIWQTEILTVQVQVVRNGGETNLHAHNGVDSMWYVLQGAGAFYDEDENRYPLQKNEMIVLPSGTRYWFESEGEEPLEILHIVGKNPNVVATRDDVTALPDRVGRIPHLQVEEMPPVGRAGRGSMILAEEDNERLCHVEGDAPMGAVFRRYWLPFALVEELPDPDCPPIRVRILGEDLVGYRDSNGAVGLLDAHCPHRRAPLYFGRNEECGLRCVYHGWKFDTAGNCVDMPSEPEYSRFRLRIHLRAYPTWEAAGMLWAYLGPPEVQPATPDYEWVRVPDTHRVVSKALEHCNYLQATEGGIDTTHSSFLHNADIQSPLRLRSRDKHPRLDVEVTEFGYRYASLRDIGEGRIYARVNNFVMPSMNTFCQMIDEVGQPARTPTVTSLFWVPMDNVTTAIYNVCWRADRGPALPLDFGEQHQERFGVQRSERIVGTYWNKRNRANDYQIDREQQRWKTYTGIEGIAIQDYAVQEGMGLITDRTKENLGSSDTAIITARRLLLEATHEVARGDAPRGQLPESHRSARPAEAFLEPGAEWRPVLEKDLVAAW